MKNRANYYFIAVSNKKNLDLCIKYGIAGFTNSINGVWAFLDIKEGDFISFIYGARVFNLYKVSKKIAIENSEDLPPWDKIKFKESGKIYYFPFRLELELIREFNEPLVRNEFSYIAENLLLRGGYRKTHFQADQTTLQNVSSMGKKANKNYEKISYGEIKTFVPKITFDRNNKEIPKIYPFSELFLQSIVKHYFSNKDNLKNLIEKTKIEDLKDLDLEILSERALPQGHVDLLIKEAIPIGSSKQVVVEVKLNKANKKDIEQLKLYLDEIGEDCIGGFLIAKSFDKKIISEERKIKLIKYNFKDIKKEYYSFDELIELFSFEIL